MTESPLVYEQRVIKARKSHECGVCGWVIHPREFYVRCTGLWGTCGTPYWTSYSFHQSCFEVFGVWNSVAYTTDEYLDFELQLFWEIGDVDFMYDTATSQWHTECV